MKRFTKRLLTGVIALGLLAPVATTTINNNSQLNVTAHASRWHRTLPGYLRGTWRSNRKMHHHKNFVTFTRHTIHSWLPNYEPTVDGAYFTNIHWHHVSGGYYITGRQRGNENGRGAYSVIKVYRHGHHISYHEWCSDSGSSHWVWIH